MSGEIGYAPVVYVVNAHRDGSLYTKAEAALSDRIQVKAWGQVATLGRLLDLLEPPVIDHFEDAVAICADYTLRLMALALIKGERL